MRENMTEKLIMQVRTMYVPVPKENFCLIETQYNISRTNQILINRNIFLLHRDADAITL